MRAVESAIRLAYRAGLTDGMARRRLRAGSYALMFHGVSSAKRSDLPASVQPYLDRSGFSRILKWLVDRAALLTADEFLSRSRPGVLLTFDDGYANNHTQALPLLIQYQAPAVLFVTTQHVSEPKNWLPSIRHEATKVWPSEDRVPDDVARDLFDGLAVSQLRECAATEGLEIGSHTRSHPLLTALDDGDLEQELVGSRQELQDWTGESVRLFAYPTGVYDQRVAAATRVAGYRAAFADKAREKTPDPDFEIPRVGIYSSDPWYLAAKLSGLHRRPLPVRSQP